MKNKLTTKEFLCAFDSICSKGEKQAHKYKLDEMYAWHDYDGYTCWLGYKDVKVTLMFHGSLKIEYGTLSNYDDFIKRCLELTVKISHQSE